MTRRWVGKPRTHLASVLALYGALAAVVQVHCRDLLTSDGQCYLRMAVYYARGDLAHALFGHWSPLWAWLMTPLVAAGMLPRVAFRLLVWLWGGAAVVGTWRLARRLGLGPGLRVAATFCAALLVTEFSAGHRVDLLVTALLLFYLDAAMDDRLARSKRWGLLVGVLGGAAYLAKLYALPFFVVHFTLVVVLHRWAMGREEGVALPRAVGAWAAGLAGFALVAAPWVLLLSVRLGRPTFGTAAATSYALVGPGSGDARRQAISGLREPPPNAYNVWQDATYDPALDVRARPSLRAPSPFRSTVALARQLRAAGRNATRVLGHLWARDRLHLSAVALALTPLALVWTRRRRRAAFRHGAVLVTVVVFCGGYALIQAENPRYFWFVFLVLAAAVFWFVGWAAGAWGRRRAAATAMVAGLAVVSFAWRPSVFLHALLGGPPPGREHRLVAEWLAARGLWGTLASTGERGWWNGLHVAYYLDAPYAGAPAADNAAGIVAEMRSAGALALLVWVEASPAPGVATARARRLRGLVAGLRSEPSLHFEGTVRDSDVPGLRGNVEVLRLRAAAGAR